MNTSDPRFQKLFTFMSVELFRRFVAFNEANPEVYKLFEKFALDAKSSGRKRFSHWMIANRIRWYTQVETTGKSFKLSNDYIACYARLLVYNLPQFEGFFLLKEMKPHRKAPRE